MAAIDSPSLCVGSALWNQRELLARLRPKIVDLNDKVDKESDLSLPQWTQLMALALDFRPNLILELGRYVGNSTCAFTEVAHALGPDGCRVESLCITDVWTATRQRITPIVGEEWFRPLTAHVADILDFDYERAFRNAGRVFVFWDAHGWDVAGCVLGRILPLLADRPHVVAMHDISDVRFAAADACNYGGRGLWHGLNGGNDRVLLGHLHSAVAQAIAIYDFASRNHLSLHTAEEQLHRQFDVAAEQAGILSNSLGPLFSLQGGWLWFSLNEISGPCTFPHFVPRAQMNWRERLKVISNVLRHGILP